MGPQPGRKAWGRCGRPEPRRVITFHLNNLPNDLFLSPAPAGERSLRRSPTSRKPRGGGLWHGGDAFIDHDHDGERDLYVANEYFSYYPTCCTTTTATSRSPTSHRARPGDEYSGYATVVAISIGMERRICWW